MDHENTAVNFLHHLGNKPKTQTYKGLFGNEFLNILKTLVDGEDIAVVLPKLSNLYVHHGLYEEFLVKRRYNKAWRVKIEKEHNSEQLEFLEIHL